MQCNEAAMEMAEHGSAVLEVLISVEAVTPKLSSGTAAKKIE